MIRMIEFLQLTVSLKIKNNFSNGGTMKKAHTFFLPKNYSNQLIHEIYFPVFRDTSPDIPINHIVYNSHIEKWECLCFGFTNQGLTDGSENELIKLAPAQGWMYLSEENYNHSFEVDCPFEKHHEVRGLQIKKVNHLTGNPDPVTVSLTGFKAIIIRIDPENNSMRDFKEGYKFESDPESNKNWFWRIKLQAVSNR